MCETDFQSTLHFFTSKNTFQNCTAFDKQTVPGCIGFFSPVVIRCGDMLNAGCVELEMEENLQLNYGVTISGLSAKLQAHSEHSKLAN